MRLVIETDLYSDVDDVGALAVAHHYADLGRAEILSIGVNTPSRYGYQAARVVNDWYGRDVPVGVLEPLDDSVFEQDYAKYLAERYGRTQDPPESAVVTHRRALAGAPDRSVTVVSLGFFGNLQGLLESLPDDISPLTGRQLVEAKVGKLVAMAGTFPQGREFNIVEEPDSARAVVAGWPTPIEFLGWEAGAEVITGKAISTRTGDVIGDAYRHYSGPGVGRASWDLLTVHLALEGADRYYELSEPGRLRIDPTGWSTFDPDPSGQHRYVSRTAPHLATELNRILEAPPLSRTR
ncbi:nucleoside hydrolase [Kribbella jejuensis]|uniref:Inosine-uridine nucleoside N-ribohydrolase n=1 Tax=Kribbella jejuensis TaxID=236068 RepID=A0A542ELA3_9ACTN|nr:nucleoside hydrolase [Kribbella jejuensis]TQJ16133.1 inosine-uridine nucleoside N-ribohydrolase [Kribbella jejuensis]